MAESCGPRGPFPKHPRQGWSRPRDPRPLPCIAAHSTSSAPEGSCRSFCRPPPFSGNASVHPETPCPEPIGSRTSGLPCLSSMPCYALGARPIPNDPEILVRGKEEFGRYLDSALKPEPWCIDSVVHEGDLLDVSGWALAPGGRHGDVTFPLNDRAFDEIDFPIFRPDLAEIFWYKPGA